MPITSWSCQLISNGKTPKRTPGAKVAVIEGPPNEAVPFTFRVKLPADFKVPAHWHPALEHVTVLSGTYNFGTGDKFDKKRVRRYPPVAP